MQEAVVQPWEPQDVPGVCWLRLKHPMLVVGVTHDGGRSDGEFGDGVS